MYIINTRKLGSTRTMTICKPEYPLEMYCDGIWNVGNLEILEIKVYITGEEMQPDKRVQLSSRDELLGVISSGAKIAYCGFKCI